MKQLKVWIVAAMMLLTFVSTQTTASTDPRTPSSKIAESKEAQVILTRLDEINAMDKTNMTASEKRILRKEVRASKKHLNEIGGGVYVSVGALLVILILLLILL